MSYVINLFGESIRYRVVELNPTLFNQFFKLAKENNTQVVDLFFDLEMLNKLGFSNWEDIPYLESNYGIIVNNCNTIEFRKNYKKIQQIKTNELLSSGLLFNDYNTTTLNNRNLMYNENYYFQIVQHEKGLFKKYRTDDALTIEKLDFQLKSLNISNKQFQLLIKINSKQLKLVEQIGDTITTSLYAERK